MRKGKNKNDRVGGRSGVPPKPINLPRTNPEKPLAVRRKALP